MKLQRLLIALTLVNVVSLVFLLARTGIATAEDAAPVLRGRALEIVDQRGRVRATITVIPADPRARTSERQGGYPETVLLRLISSEGRPNVKISATDLGAAVSFSGASDPTGVQILADSHTAIVKLSNQDGHEHLVKP